VSTPLLKVAYGESQRASLEAQVQHLTADRKKLQKQAKHVEIRQTSIHSEFEQLKVECEQVREFKSLARPFTDTALKPFARSLMAHSQLREALVLTKKSLGEKDKSQGVLLSEVTSQVCVRSGRHSFAQRLASVCTSW
jgi:hypothetical protein